MAKNPASGPTNIVKIQRASAIPCVFISMSYFLSIKSNINMLIEKQAKMALISINLY